MNRYVADGLIADARYGHSVGFGSLGRVSDATFHLVAERATDAVRVTRAHGHQRIDFASGGRIVFLSSDRTGYRGHVFDVLVLDESSLSQRTIADAVPCVQTGGELILV